MFLAFCRLVVQINEDNNNIKLGLMIIINNNNNFHLIIKHDTNAE